MKKIISLSLALALCASILLCATSCGGNSAIEDFKKKMDDAGNYEMTLTMSNVPFFGTITMVTQVDGNVEHLEASTFSDEQYSETVGDVTYQYTKNEDGTFTKAQTEKKDKDSDVTSEKSMSQFFNPDNYDKVDENTYKQNKNATFDSFKDVEITFENDSCTIQMVSIEEGYNVELVISKIGEIDLELPSAE